MFYSAFIMHNGFIGRLGERDSAAERAGTAWAGIAPPDVAHRNGAVNEQVDLTCQCLEIRTSGVLVFKAAERADPHDFLMHERDDNGRGIVSFSFRAK